MENVDFYVHGYKEIQIGGATVYITTTHVCLAIVLLVLIIFAIVANRTIKKADPTKAPTGFLNIIELLVETVDNLVFSNMGKTLAPRFKNYIGAVFTLIIVCNLSGLFGLRPPTADYGVTLPLALITFIMIQYQGFKWQRMGKIKGLFEPIFLFLPVNIISEFATPISLSLRLFANILSGTMMMTLIYGLLPKLVLIAWPAALHAYLDVFAGALQAYVFAMLTMVFITNAADVENASPKALAKEEKRIAKLAKQ
ncbi:MAG: F0F1 ATP synthase subunit A [Eubacterium sp.]|nr:F0F1 ATP synthase subunit A [Eubacterium sp.]